LTQKTSGPQKAATFAAVVNPALGVIQTACHRVNYITFRKTIRKNLESISGRLKKFLDLPYCPITFGF